MVPAHAATTEHENDRIRPALGHSPQLAESFEASSHILPSVLQVGQVCDRVATPRCIEGPHSHRGLHSRGHLAEEGLQGGEAALAHHQLATWGEGVPVPVYHHPLGCWIATTPPSCVLSRRRGAVARQLRQAGSSASQKWRPAQTFTKKGRERLQEHVLAFRVSYSWPSALGGASLRAGWV